MIGIDVLHIDRIEKLKKKERLFARIFSDNELSYIAKKNKSPQTIAGLFCAKEAVSKVFGTGMGAKIFFNDIEILHRDGAPTINIHRPKLKKLMNEHGYEDIKISISHDGDLAIAVAFAVKGEDFPELDPQMAKLLPERNDNFHKYDYGKVLMIGGKKGMHGSVTLASKAAMRTGAGLTHLLVPSSLENAISQNLIEVITKTYPSDENGAFGDFDQEEFIDYIKSFDAIAFGPGIGQGKEAGRMLNLLLKHFQGPLVIDADGINLLAKAEPFEKTNIYLTPHEGEFSRLGALSKEEIRKDRLKACQRYLEDHNLKLLLKGKNSIIIDRNSYYINGSGSSALATAGSGDCLTGILLSLLAREDSINMLRLAAYIHGLCGDFAASELGEDSVIASDLIDYLPKVLKGLRELQDLEGK